MFVRHLIITTAAILASSLTLSTVVRAEDAHVVYHPSELTTDAGRQAVVRRIHHAANAACFRTANADVMENMDCARQLSQQMIAKLGSPKLVAQPDNHKLAAR